jgi:hypothetical protein
MFTYFAFGILATIVAIVAKNAYDPEFTATMTAIVGTLITGLIAFLIVPGMFISYQTEYVKPLAESKAGVYHKSTTVSGEVAYQYKTVNGPVRTLSDATDDDEDEDEVNLYYTRGKPRVERRCSYPDDWTVPFGWEWKGFNGCDTNIYVPIEKEKVSW